MDPIREIVRDEVHKLLDRDSEIMTTNDRLWLMRNDAHREIDLLRVRLAAKDRLIVHLEHRIQVLADTNTQLYADIDRMYQDIKLDKAVLVQVKDRLETWWPQLTSTAYGKRMQTIAPAAEFLVECYDAVCKRIRNV